MITDYFYQAAVWLQPVVYLMICVLIMQAISALNGVKMQIWNQLSEDEKALVAWIIERAVRIGQYSAEISKDEGDPKLPALAEARAEGIANDVLMQHGFDLQNYNVRGLLRAERQKIGLPPPKEEGIDG